MRPELTAELLAVAVLLSQADIDLRAPGAPVLVASDASQDREAAVVSSVPEDFSRSSPGTVCKRGSGPGSCPLCVPCSGLGGSWNRAKSFLAPVFRPTLCGRSFARPLHSASVHKVSKRRHINIGELRAALRAEARLGRLHPGARYLHLLDSQVALGALVKGRAASPALNYELTRSLPEHLGSRIRPFYGYSVSALNPADDPTRLRTVRAPQKVCPSWLEDALKGEYGGFDNFLASEGLHPDQLRDLPDPRELAPDLSVDPLLSRFSHRDRAVKPAEARAHRLLSQSLVSRKDLLDLFNALPSVPCKSANASRTGRLFQVGACSHNGVTGVLRATRELPNASAVTARFVAQICPSPVAICENAWWLPPRVQRSLGPSIFLVCAMTKFAGGRIWIQTDEGPDSLRIGGCKCKGFFVDSQSGPVLIDPARRHTCEKWRGRKVLLFAFCAPALESLSEEDTALLSDLGFPLPQPGTEVPEAAPDGEPLLPVLVPAKPSSAFLRAEGRHAQGCVFAPSAGPRPADFSDLVGLPPCFRGLSPSQFEFSDVFSTLADAVSKGSGWVDLFSGS